MIKGKKVGVIYNLADIWIATEWPLSETGVNNKTCSKTENYKI